jgi:hypothetical protein
MNINNSGGNSGNVQKLTKNFEQAPVHKAPQSTKIETGMTGQTFAERKAAFERQPGQTKVDDLASPQLMASVDQAIDESSSDHLLQKSQSLPGLYTPIEENGNTYTSSLNGGYTLTDEVGTAYQYQSAEYHEIEPSQDPLLPAASQEPKKHTATTQNHHEVLRREDTIAPGIKKGDEFALRGAGRYTAMFQGDAQKKNR